jgi:zinc protease
MTDRRLPPVGAPARVVFPPIVRATLSSGLDFWTISRHADPVVSAQLVLHTGAGHDPADRPGLVGLTADMLDEGAAGRDAVAIAEILARLGTTLAIDVGSDATGIGFLALERCLEPALAIVGDLVARPQVAEPDLARVRELRQHRLRQLSSTPGAVADRALLAAIFGAHPYGHGTLGTSAALSATTLADVRECHAAMCRPDRATLIVVGDVSPARVAAAAEAAFGTWRTSAAAPPEPLAPATLDAGARPPVILVDRPGAPQSELRVGHIAPGRHTPDFHALVTLNAILGGQFTSRLNTNLRETRAITYGVRTAFEFRRTAGSFACDASVQADATATAAAEVLREFAAIGEPGAVPAAELERAQATLTRGYVRQFETAEQLLRAAAQLAIHGLPDDTYDRFVPAIEGLTPAAIEAAARRTIQAHASAVVVVGDAASTRPALASLGRPIVEATPEF